MKTYKIFLLIFTSLLGCHFSALGVEEDDIKFHVPFEGSFHAVTAEGEETGAPDKKAAFAEGISGKGFQCGKGGAALRFIRQDNIDFDNPGTVNVWFKLDCGHGKTGPAIPFWGVGADLNRGILSVTVLNDPMKHCPCRRQIGFIMLSKQRRKFAQVFAVGTGKRRICSGWHLISAAWSGKKLYVSLDGIPYRSFELTKPVSNAELGYQRRFAVGSSNPKWQYVIDEFTIFGKKLSDMEIQEIYQKGMKAIAEKEKNKK